MKRVPRLEQWTSFYAFRKHPLVLVSPLRSPRRVVPGACDVLLSGQEMHQHRCSGSAKFTANRITITKALGEKMWFGPQGSAAYCLPRRHTNPYELRVGRSHH